jgi:two-component system LytT family sensor kinase
VPPLLLIPFVENAFKHGINAQFGNAWVRIDLRLDDKQHDFIFIIENNKPSSEEKLNHKNGGIGILNAQKRLHMLYPDAHTLFIRENELTYIIELRIPKL